MALVLGLAFVVLGLGGLALRRRRHAPLSHAEVTEAMAAHAAHEAARGKPYVEAHRQVAIAQRVEQARHRAGRAAPADLLAQVRRHLTGRSPR